jgi:hypothetical protein
MLDPTEGFIMRVNETSNSDPNESPAESNNFVAISRQMLWLRHGDSSGTHERGRPQLQSVTTGLVKTAD